MGGGGQKTPQADPNIGYAALMNAQLGGEWLSIAREQFGVANARQAKLDALNEKVTNQQLTSMENANKWAAEDRERYKTVFQPLQDQYIQTAKNWDSAEHQAEVASEAKADVMNGAAQANQTLLRQQSAMGINPASGRFAGTARAAATATGLASAGAQNNARTTVRNQAIAMRADAANMGQGLPSQAVQSLGLGANIGNSVVANGVNVNQAWNMGNQILQSGYQTAMQGYLNQGNLLNNLYANQIDAYKAQSSANSGGGIFGQLMGGIGSIAGLFMSDEDAKTDKTPVRGALEAVKGMPVEEWSYKPGMGDGGRHIGTYAQDFQRQTGKGDGKTIPVIDAIGVTMGAVKELADKVDALSGAKGRGVLDRKPSPKGRGIIREAA